MKIRMHLTIGYAVGNHETIEEVDDDISEDELDDMVSEWAHNYIEFGWQKLEDDKEE